jgi:lipid-binding SYLF domain-containing protein
MTLRNILSVLAALLVLAAPTARAASDDETIKLFKDAGESAKYFDHSYGYAVFSSIGKGGIGIGGAYGKGNVYERGKHIGTVSMSQLSLGLQLGGQAYSHLLRGPARAGRVHRRQF